MGKTYKDYNKFKELKRQARRQVGQPPPVKVIGRRKRGKYRIKDETNPEYWIKGDGQEDY